MRLPRMTTRRWMVAVAVIALVLGVVATLKRSAHFMRLAAMHDHLAQATRSRGVDPKAVDHNELLARKYEYAARYPWLPVEPDPPEPR